MKISFRASRAIAKDWTMDKKFRTLSYSKFRLFRLWLHKTT